MRVHLKALGCRLNEAELQTWAGQFAARGCALVDSPATADLVVLNSCAVTAEAVRKSRQLMRRAQRHNPAARLVVSGCYATLEPGAAEAALGVDLVVSNQDKPRLVDMVARAFALPDAAEPFTESDSPTLFALGRERAFVKIQDGCRYRCTFCIVTVARGLERSRTIPEVVSEINTLHAGGVREAVLTGVHVGGYGSDIGCSLADLVRAILLDTDIPRIRFASVEPWDLPPDFFELFADRRLMPHMHLPLQSGSDSVLKRMARRCKTAAFERLVARARSCVPGFNVTTDIIVGFPGESDSEWTETLDFVERVGFGHLHIFPFSPRQGTKAARLPDPVARDVKQSRGRQLHELGARMKRQALTRWVGARVPVLWESGGCSGNVRSVGGYTPSYFRCAGRVDAGTDLAGQIRDARITGVSPSGDVLVAEPYSP
jgi:threonylcarbamoyladenosine tRNA methylthiotransferase MtaB